MVPDVSYDLSERAFILSQLYTCISDGHTNTVIRLKLLTRRKCLGFLGKIKDLIIS